MISTVRVQEKGQVTIPRTIRRQLNLKKGDLGTFISTLLTGHNFSPTG